MGAIIFLFGCSGEEGFGVDTTPPHKARMIAHLGDTGDVIIDSLHDYYNTNDPEFENNGIDAISDGNKIQIQWEPIIDSDIDYINIMRFRYTDYLNDSLHFVSCIDTVDYTGQIHYFDNIPSDHMNKKLFYYLDIFDFAGNSTVSDTVCYQLKDKPLPTPIPDNMNILEFEWVEDETISAYRILLFNNNHNLIWSKNPQDFDEMPISYTGIQLQPGYYSWRVDVFGETEFITESIDGNIYIVKSGAESEEDEFRVD